MKIYQEMEEKIKFKDLNKQMLEDDFHWDNIYDELRKEAVVE
jgi:hypothetical protein